MSAGRSCARWRHNLPRRAGVLASGCAQDQGDRMPKTTDYLRLEAFRATPLVQEPFQHLIVPGFISPDGLAAINADYPKISSSGSFPVDQVSFGRAFQDLLDELESDEFRGAFEEKFGLDLSGRPTVTTVRGRCDLSDGRIHTEFDQQDHHRADLYERKLGPAPAAGCGFFAPPKTSTTSLSKCRRCPARCWPSNAATIPGMATSRSSANAGSFNSTGSHRRATGKSPCCGTTPRRRSSACWKKSCRAARKRHKTRAPRTDPSRDRSRF